MNGSQRYDYLGSTTIFLRNKEYERHQKKLEEIKNLRAKGTYYNKSHIEGIRVHNNIKVNNNKFKDRLKNDELQINNNKILKKIIEISRNDNGLSKTNNLQISPRRINFEEVDKIIRENQILSNKINNVDSQLNNRKFASQYQQLYECKRRIQRFEVIDYDKNQVKLKAYDLANSTYNGGLSQQAHSRLSHRKGSLNLNNNPLGDEIVEYDEQGQQKDGDNSLNESNLQNNNQRSNQTNGKYIQINTSQNTPRGQQFDSGRAKSCERERTSLYKKQQFFQVQRQASKTREREGSPENNPDHQNQNKKENRKAGTSEQQGRHRSVSRGNGMSTRNSYEPSKNPSDSQLPSHRYFRNYKRAVPERQSLNLTPNSIGQQKLNLSDEQSLNKTGESQYKNSTKNSSNFQKEGQFYNEENYGYGKEEDNLTYNPKGPVRYNQNFIEKTRESQSDERKSTQAVNKDNSQEKEFKQIKNSSRISSAKGAQRDNLTNNLRSGTPNKINLNSQLQHQQQQQNEDSAKTTPRNRDLVKQIDQTGNSQVNNKKEAEKINKQQSNQQKNPINRSQISNQSQKVDQSHHNKHENKLKKSNLNEENLKVDENISSHSKTLNQESEEIEDEYNQEDEDFVQQDSVQVDEETQKKFSNNSKNFYKDKKKEQFQIVEQEEYEDDFESQLIQSSNLQNKNQSQTHKNPSQMNASNKEYINNQNKKKENYNDDLQQSNQFQLSSSLNTSEIKTDKSKLVTSQIKKQENNPQQNLKVKEVQNDLSQQQNSKQNNCELEESIQDYEDDNFEADN